MKFDYMQKTQGMNYCSRLAKFMHKRKIEELKSLFKSKIGYDGYYLDSGKLKRTS